MLYFRMMLSHVSILDRKLIWQILTLTEESGCVGFYYRIGVGISNFLVLSLLAVQDMDEILFAWEGTPRIRISSIFVLQVELELMHVDYTSVLT